MPRKPVKGGKKGKKGGGVGSLYLILIAVVAVLFYHFYVWNSGRAEDTVGSDIPSGTLEVHFIDVGQADCILIKEPHGKAMLVDSGNGADKKLIERYLTEQSVTELEYVIFTHPHEDHIGSGDSIVRDYSIKNIIMPDAVHTSMTFQKLISAIDDKGIKPTRPVPGDKYELGDAVFTVLAPSSEEYDELNNYSVVVKLEYGSTSFLLTGDAEKKSEKEMLSFAEDSGISLKCDVLKVGHHGSSSSSTDSFVSAVSPKYAFITCEKDNDYDHPHKQTLDTIKKYGVTVYRADLDGTVVFYSDGKSLTVRTQRDSEELSREAA